VHASLLPRWRGAAPIQAAIVSGDTTSGATIMKMDPGIDTGPILSQKEIPILTDDTSASLTPRLAQAGADLLIDTLPSYLEGSLQPEPQDNARATYAPMLKKEEGFLDFNQPVITLANRIRAFNPWPGTYTFWQSQPLKIHRARALPDVSARPGVHRVIGGWPAIGAEGGWLVLEELQPAGKRVMAAQEFLPGARGWTEQVS
jgi:methionyl-tRNA formyltransferase